MSDTGPMEKMAENGIAIGLVFGVIVGAATDNMGLWLSLGIVFGVSVFSQYGSNSEGAEESTSEDPPTEAEDKE
jgi:hypothetical protein